MSQQNINYKHRSSVSLSTYHTIRNSENKKQLKLILMHSWRKCLCSKTKYGLWGWKKSRASSMRKPAYAGQLNKTKVLRAQQLAHSRHSPLRLSQSPSERRIRTLVFLSVSKLSMTQLHGESHAPHAPGRSPFRELEQQARKRHQLGPFAGCSVLTFPFSTLVTPKFMTSSPPGFLHCHLKATF